MKNNGNFVIDSRHEYTLATYTRDVPPNSLAVGCPCRVIREITDTDRLSAHPEYY